MASIEGLSYIVEQGEAETRLETVEQVCDLLDRIAASESADVSVVIDRGRRPSWLKRLFGFSERMVTPCFILQKAGGVAALTFLDEAWSEYRAIDKDRPDGISEDIRHKLSGGEPTPADPEVCMTAERAFVAARHYLRRGTRPDWLSYRYVR
jgi:hypothetical protein